MLVYTLSVYVGFFGGGERMPVSTSHGKMRASRHFIKILGRQDSGKESDVPSINQTGVK